MLCTIQHILNSSVKLTVIMPRNENFQVGLNVIIQVELIDSNSNGAQVKKNRTDISVAFEDFDNDNNFTIAIAPITITTWIKPLSALARPHPRLRAIYVQVCTCENKESYYRSAKMTT